MLDKEAGELVSFDTESNNTIIWYNCSRIWRSEAVSWFNRASQFSVFFTDLFKTVWVLWQIFSIRVRELEFLVEIARIACCRDFGIGDSRAVGGLVPERGSSGGQAGGITIGVPLDRRSIPIRRTNFSTVHTWETFSTACGLRQNKKVKLRKYNKSRTDIISVQ